MKGYFKYKGAVNWDHELEVANVCQTAIEVEVTKKGNCGGTYEYLLIRTIDGEISIFTYGPIIKVLGMPFEPFKVEYRTLHPKRKVEGACLKEVQKFVSRQSVINAREIKIKDFLNNYIDPTITIDDKLDYENTPNTEQDNDEWAWDEVGWQKKL